MTLPSDTAPWAVRSTAAPPHVTGGGRHRHILQSWLAAASMVGCCGVVFYGPAALIVLAVGPLAALAADLAIAVVLRRPVLGGLMYSFLMGFLLSLTLPATVPLYVPVVGSIVAVGVKAMFGRMGHCVWHPALVGRVVVQFVFWQQLSLSPGNATLRWPVLNRNHLVIGDISDARPIPAREYQGWQVANKLWPRPNAFLIDRPVALLRAFTEGVLSPEEGRRFSSLVRDILPPWRDTILGTVPGGIGETCTAALVLAGLFLIYRGHLRWQLPVALLGAAALAAAILPVNTGGGAGGYRWIPALAVEDGRAVGVAYVLFQLTAGQLMLGAVLLAGDMMLTPMRTRGQIVYAIGIGVLTIFLRLYGPLEGACYWSILVMNTLVPAIDRSMKRPILGLPD
ncbi:MAG: RnfABCDGE type electron transport complex subunit D [Phycisphaerae bacterium]